MERMPSKREAKEGRLVQPELTCMAEGLGVGDLEQVLRLLSMAHERTTSAIQHIRRGQQHAQRLTRYPYGHDDLSNAA